MSSPPACSPASPAAAPAAPQLVLGALLLATLAFSVSQTVVLPALPQIREAYGASATSVSWILTGYLLAASVATPIAGKLGDVHGRRRVLTVVLLVFCAGTVICGLADSVEVLVAGRVVQGVAGGIFPLAFGIINDVLPARRRAGAIGLISAMFGIGGGIALPLAGVAVQHLDISWLFWSGLVALPAAAATWRAVPEAGARRRTRVDWRGALVLSAGLTAVLLAISRANAWGWASASFAATLAAGGALLGAFVALQARTEAPLVDLAVLRERPVAATNATAGLMGLAMFSSFFLIPQFAQTAAAEGYGFGLSVTGAGLIMLPISLMMLVGGSLAGALAARIGLRLVLAVGGLSVATAFLLLAALHGAVWHFALAGLVQGLGMALAFAAMANLVVSSVRPDEVGIATGINAIMRTVGGAFGSALAAALLAARTAPGAAVPAEDAYTIAFAVSGVIALAAVAAALAVPRPGRAPAGPTAAPATAQAAGARVPA